MVHSNDYENPQYTKVLFGSVYIPFVLIKSMFLNLSFIVLIGIMASWATCTLFDQIALQILKDYYFIPNF